MKRIRLDSSAREEFLHEVRYYEDVRAGTGRKFREAVNAVFDRMRHDPHSGAPEDEGCRRLRVRGFPFSVVYREERDEIVVWAIKADARRPGYWPGRAK